MGMELSESNQRRLSDMDFYQDESMPPFVQQMIKLGKTVQIYVPEEYFTFEKSEWKIPKFIGQQMNAKDTEHLHYLHSWLYNHDEYQANPYYIQGRLTQVKNTCSYISAVISSFYTNIYTYPEIKHCGYVYTLLLCPHSL